MLIAPSHVSSLFLYAIYIPAETNISNPLKPESTTTRWLEEIPIVKNGDTDDQTVLKL